MLTFFTIVHVLLCVFMIFVILLQPGKDAGMGSALGGGAATSAFGGRGAVTFLSKLTGVCAGLFFLTSLGLSMVGLRSSVAAGSVATPPAKTAPATPGATTPAPAAPGAVEQERSATPPAEGQQQAPAPTTPAAPAPAPAQ
ncbi:preprotein translocase subunit SecG [Corallococcus sp. EGB]|uniref:preprotein translocase subunit SecG n=1 Tax=Corallococcus sp. EGB TaxID=1521117 RepID=UPI001CBDA2D7|nr:preprotein translocase subunit SecG [Corallococcus sp. EGB]